MSNFPNNPGYNPQSANQYAVMTPPPRQDKKGLPLVYTAGGGLFVGVVAGLLLISAGPESPAVAATPVVEVQAPAPTLGDLAANEAPEPVTEPVTEPVADSTEPIVADPETVIDEGSEEGAEPAPAVDEAIEASLRFEVTPPEVQADLKIAIDGESITTDTFSLMLNGKTKSQKIQLTATADGYRDFKKSIKVSGDMSVPIAMRKVPARGSNSGRSGGDRGSRNRGNKSGGPGGLLDL